MTFSSLQRMTTVFIISAPSGSGKSTLVARLMAVEPGLRFSVSYTTRKPRGTEKPGESYVYISRQEFISRIAQGEFLEHAEVFGNFYGTSREVLEQRLRSRSQDSEEVIQRRLSEAAEEIRNYSQYDYVLVNKDIDASVDNLVAIVSANRSRRHWMEQQIRPILETF